MHLITIQFAIPNKALVPKVALLRKWARKALSEKNIAVELTLRIVGVSEMAELNSTYRKKQGPTNVLSFPYEPFDNIPADENLLGDIVMCEEVVNQEALVQHKAPEAHWAHMVVHGVYHLLGYDHENEQDAEIMEALEINTLRTLGFPNPYESGENIKYHD